MSQVFINNYRTTLSQTLGFGDTVAYVDSTANMPVLGVGDFFLLTLFRLTGIEESGHEVVKVTGVTANALTVERSYEGAAPSVFATGSKVEARLTAKSIDVKVDKETGKGLSTNDYSNADKTKMDSVATDATKNASDAFLRARANHTGTQAIASIDGLVTALGGKVDVVGGKTLTTNDFTNSLKSKLDGVAVGATANASDASLRERVNHTGNQEIATITGLQAVLDSKVVGVAGKGLSTNDYTTAEKNKLGTINPNATANASDASLKNRNNHTGTQAIATIDGLVDALASPTINNTWNNLPDKPLYIAEGSTAALARSAIGAGTSNLAVGTAASNAKPGNWFPTVAMVDGLTDALATKQDTVNTLSVAYSANGFVNSYNENGKVRSITYNADGTVYTIKNAVGSKLRTETYTYTNGLLTGMTATEV